MGCSERTGGAVLCLLLPIILSACDMDAQAEPAQPTTAASVSQGDFTNLSQTVQQNQTKLAQLEQGQVAAQQAETQSQQRLAALEQRFSALQQSLVNLTRENQQMQAQLTQTRAELAATQEQLRRLQGQAYRARRAVREYRGGR